TIEWFRRENPRFRDMTRERLVELGIDPSPLLTASYGARTFTHRQGTESFFFCVLWKRRGINTASGSGLVDLADSSHSGSLPLRIKPDQYELRFEKGIERSRNHRD